MSEPQSVVLVPLPSVDAAIGALRRAHDPAARDDIPSHVTLNTPFVPPDEIDEQTRFTLDYVAGEVNTFYVELSDVGCFERDGAFIVHLRAQPAAVFRRLAQRVLDEWPQYPMFGGAVALDEYVPHVTIGYGDAAFVERVRTELEPKLPLVARATGLALLSGVVGERWIVRHGATFR